ncbi:MAG TPA: hypothetical protein VKS62_02510 [Methylomirabilota bacterium]|nr:hypothetical protein [Methylomirabilota bacterium]
MRLLSRDEMDRLRPAETHAFPGPVPTQIVSSGGLSWAARAGLPS